MQELVQRSGITATLSLLKGCQGCIAAIRQFSSASNQSAAQAHHDFVQLNDAPNSAVIVQLPERGWGARAFLPQDALPAGNKVSKAGTLAVLREPFACHDDKLTPLQQVLTGVASGVMAFNSAFALPHQRFVVDEYIRDNSRGGFRLAQTSTDLLQYLQRHDVHVCYVPDLRRAQRGDFNSVRGALNGRRRNCTNEVLMVAPTAFGFNEQTAADNYFMHTDAPPEQASSLTHTVLREYYQLHAALCRAGVQVNLFEHSLQHKTPDAVFPNNWFSTHLASEGQLTSDTLVLYPMKCPNRAAERRPEIVDVLRSRSNYEVFDLSGEEANGRYFEGTGALVLDRVNGIAYVALSERADRSLAERWAQRMGYKELVTFHSTDENGHPVYHTNVMMCVGTDVAIVCSESVADVAEREHLLGKLRSTHAVVEITMQQMNAMCGNAIELKDARGLPVLAMSSQAHAALTPEQRSMLLQHVADIVHAPITTLERVGGGSTRCCIGEVFKSNKVN